MADHGKHGPSKEKAKEMLRHGSVHGKKLTKKQKGFFGAIAGGNSRVSMHEAVRSGFRRTKL